MFQTISNPLAAPLVVLATFLSVGMLPAVAAEEYPYHGMYIHPSMEFSATGKETLFPPPSVVV